MSESPGEIFATDIPDADWNDNFRRGLRFSIDDALMWMCVALCPFQDTILQYTPLNMAGASLSFFPLVVLFALAGARRLLHKPFVVSRSMLLLVVYMCAVCAANLVWMENGEATIYWKSLRGYPLLAALTVFAIFGVNYQVSRWFRRAIYLAFCFTVAGILCGFTLGENAILILQSSPNLSGRPSGFSTESSTLSVQIVAIGMLTAHFLDKKWKKLSIGALTCALLVVSGSKGGLISLLLCAIVLGIAKIRASLLSKIIVSFVLLPLIYFSSFYVYSIFSTLVELNQMESIATRLSMAVYAFITVAHHPLGVGFTGFLPSIPRYLPQAMDFIQGVLPISLFFEEAKGFLYPPQTFADCKSFFLDYLVFFGIPFAILFFRFAGKLILELFKCHYYWLFLGVLFSTFALMTYYSSINVWTLPVLFGVSLHEIRRVQNPVRVQ